MEPGIADAVGIVEGDVTADGVGVGTTDGVDDGADDGTTDGVCDGSDDDPLVGDAGAVGGGVDAGEAVGLEVDLGLGGGLVVVDVQAISSRQAKSGASRRRRVFMGRGSVRATAAHRS